MARKNFIRSPFRVHSEISLHFQVSSRPIRQGVQAAKYLDIQPLEHPAGRDASTHENVKLFLSEPLGKDIDNTDFF